MSEKLKRIEFKADYRLRDQEIVGASGFLLKTTRAHRETERRRIKKEIDEGTTNVAARREAAARNFIDDPSEVRPQQEFSARVRWLDESVWKSYYELMGRLTARDDRLSMISMNVGFIGIKPVLLEQHWHTDDLDEPDRDYTEFQYIVGDPETMGNPPLVEEIAGYLDFVTEGSSVSDKEIPRIETFGTVPQEVLREILPSPQPVSG